VGGSGGLGSGGERNEADDRKTSEYGCLQEGVLTQQCRFLSSAKLFLERKPIRSQTKFDGHHGSVCANLAEAWRKRRYEAPLSAN